MAYKFIELTELNGSIEKYPRPLDIQLEPAETSTSTTEKGVKKGVNRHTR